MDEPQAIPKDPYLDSRQLPQYKHVTPSSFDKLKQFLTMDRKVLRFYCVWDDRDSMFGEMRSFVSSWIYLFACLLSSCLFTYLLT